MEVLYSIGVMLTIFLILTGISFQRRMDTQDTLEYLDKRDICLNIADAISSISTSGPGSYRSVYARYDAQILDDVVVVGEVGPTANPDAVSATCIFSANITNPSSPYGPPITLAQGTAYKIENIRGNIQVT